MEMPIIRACEKHPNIGVIFTTKRSNAVAQALESQPGQGIHLSFWQKYHRGHVGRCTKEPGFGQCDHDSMIPWLPAAGGVVCQ
jgi:hypothetical protein